VSHGWDDPATAREWDAQGDEINPTRHEQLDILVSVLADHVRPGDWILDLGAGSGQVESLVLERIADVGIVGVDNSLTMLALAKERLAPYGERFLAVEGDLRHLTQVSLPALPVRAVIAVQSLHHLTASEMRSVYGWVYERLPAGGLFLLLDRLQVNEATFALVRSLWLRLDRRHGTRGAAEEGESFSQHVDLLAANGDRPQALERHLAWLASLGLQPVLLHLHGNRGLLAAVK
jgi:SAM-dependent methyltransferase